MYDVVTGDGARVGDLVGDVDGRALGVRVGRADGARVGVADGLTVGLNVGSTATVGASVSCVGAADGVADGKADGAALGRALGTGLGNDVGDGVGDGAPRTPTRGTFGLSWFALGFLEACELTPLYALLASFPHWPVMAPEPPGCRSRHAVASYMMSSMINQQSEALLCACTSAKV